MTIKFVIPVIMEDVTDRCLAQYDLDWRDLILIDNSKTGFAKKYEEKGATVHYHPENLGVAKSWNIGLDSEADYVWIISASMVFTNGFSDLISKMCYANKFGLLTNQAWHCICLGRRTIIKVGKFDDNFYPAYFEDTDYIYRLKLAKIHGLDEIMLPKVEVEVQPVENALTIRRGVVEVNFDKLLTYYIKKWGGMPNNEKFDIPFGGQNG